MSRKLTLTIIAILGIALTLNGNTNIESWLDENYEQYGVRITKVETPSVLPFIQLGDFATIEVSVNENGKVIQTQAIEHNNSDFADAYEYALYNWKFESKGRQYKVVIPFVAKK